MASSKSVAPIASLRQRIRIQYVVRADDGQGGFTDTWTDLITTGDFCLWAKVEPKKSQERYFSQQIQYQRTHVVTLRYLDSVSSDMRFLFMGRTFQIKGVRYPDEEKFMMILDCEENQGT